MTPAMKELVEVAERLRTLWRSTKGEPPKFDEVFEHLHRAAMAVRLADEDQRNKIGRGVRMAAARKRKAKARKP